MSETLKFNHIYYKKHITSKIKIKNGTLVLMKIVILLRLIKRNTIIKKRSRVR